MTGIRAVACQPEEIANHLAALRSYSRVFIDVGYPSIAATGESSADGLEALRALDISHHEILAISADADIAWLKGQVEYWQGEQTRYCLLNEYDSSFDVGGLVSLLIEKKMPLGGIVQAALMPDSIQPLSKASLLTRLSQTTMNHSHGAVPIVC